MNRCRCLRVLIVLFAGLLPTLTAAQTLSLRDAETGAPISAQVLAQALDAATAKPAQVFRLNGLRQTLPLQSGRWQLQISAPGYQSLSAIWDATEHLPMTVLLQPLPDSQAVRVAAQGNVLQGIVRRADDAAPLAAAHVQLQSASQHWTTHSDADGRFSIEHDDVDFAAEQPLRASLRVDAAGLPGLQRDGLLLLPGVSRIQIALGGDTPTWAQQEIGALDRLDGGLLGHNARPDMPLSTTPMRASAAVLAPLLTPPASIRVGYADAACTSSCCTSACDNVCVMPLETYVRRGLDSEWIASWQQPSLRAGSVAYRGYAMWRVANPIRTGFDICSSACCQVNDAGTNSNTDAAIARTPGIALSLTGTTPLSAEYSAENNGWDDPADGLNCSNADLCGDGVVGSPATGWPCLIDTVAAGHGCFGHGRGMSQWGTQRWAQHASAPSWSWIVDHYYNDNNNASGAGSGLRAAVMTSPLTLAGVAVTPATQQPGATLSISATASNLAGAAHDHLLIGASLYRSGVGYLDDSAHDTPLSLQPGSAVIARDFDIPLAVTLGSYDVLLSLYLDVDENGAISSNDLPLALITLGNAVNVALPPVALFADGFEATL